METTDLMKGDYVHTPNGNFRITAIQDNDVIFTDYADDIRGACDIEDIRPIIINEEILIRVGVGFCTSKRNPMHGWLTDSMPDGKLFRVEYNKTTAQSGKVLGVQFLGECGYVSKTFNLPLPKYVHELQHALKLCGIEIEINF